MRASDWPRAPRRHGEVRPAESAELLYELQVHQFELEMQNEELRRTQLALADARDRYLDLYEFAPVGYLTIGQDGLIEEANLAAATLLGAERQALLGARFAAFVTAEHLTHWQETFVRTVKRGERVSCDLVMRRREGSVFHGRVDCSSRTGEVVPGARIVLTDMTERDHADEELRTAERMESLAVLAGGIAHDFNNLLTALFGHIEAARETVAPDGPADQDLRVSVSALEEARGLTRQLLVFAGGGEPHRTALAMPKVLANAVALVLGGSAVGAHIETADDLPLVDADEGQLGQLFDNLLLNARQAMPSGGDVRISAGRRSLSTGQSPVLPGGEYVEVSIQDRGHGIPKDILSRIFEPFFSTKSAGRGLGLAVSHAVVRRHGGQLSVHSEEGVGTTFTVLLPAAPAGAVASMRAPLQRTSSPASEGLRVLLMDDEPLNLKAGIRHLVALGCTADTAARGEEALALYQASLAAGTPYDLVILDLTVVGGMGGQRTIEKLRQLDPKVIAVACSGYFEGGIMANPDRHGFRAVLPKPYSRGDLSAVLGLVTAS